MRDKVTSLATFGLGHIKHCLHASCVVCMSKPDIVLATLHLVSSKYSHIISKPHRLNSIVNHSIAKYIHILMVDR